MSASFSSNSSAPKTILLVDDNPENLYAIGSLLQPNYRVRTVRGGAAALESVSRPPYPDLILLDIMMPDIDGYEVLRRLKATPETSSIPVIFVTAMESHGDEAYGLGLGAVDFITKPVVPALLLARVHAHLVLKEARDWLQDRNEILAAEVAHQVVELKVAKEAAEVASEAKTLFINNMGHELRTPMNGVIGMLQLAQIELPPGHPALEYIGVALESSQTMVTLLAAILEYASIAHGEVALHKQPLDPAALLDIAALEWRPRAEAKGLRFAMTKRSDLPSAIEGDQARLKRVLSTLLDNALKFTPSGEIELGAEPDEGSIHLWVRDSGIGIPAEKWETIFNPFEQADNSHTRQYSGAGLGLAIAHRLVELMGGRLWVESAPAAGSTFHVTLPLTP
jgi:signal transduction histidine kinase